MLRKLPISRIVFGLLSLTILLSCGGGEKKTKALDPDLIFCTSVAHGALMLSELGKMANGTPLGSETQQLRPTFDTIYNDLRALIIQKSKILYPKALPDEKLAQLKILKAKSGADLEQHLRSQIREEMQTLHTAFRTVQKEGKDGDIKEWARAHFSIIQQNLDAFR